MWATVQKCEATEHVFSHLKNTRQVFSLATLLLWSLNLRGFVQSGSRNQSAAVFMTFNYVPDNSRNLVLMEHFCCSAVHTGAWVFFLHTGWQHTVVRCIVLWHRSMYSQQWLRIHFIAAFLFAIWANYNIKKRRNPSGAHLQDQTGRDFQINLNCHFTCGNHVLPTSSRWICRHILEWFHFSQSAWNLFYSITKYPSFPPHLSMYRWLTELMEQLGLSGAKVYRELKWNQNRPQKVPSFKITMAFGRLHKLQELAM